MRAKTNKAAQAKAAEAQSSQRRKLVQEYAELDEQVRLFKPHLLRHEKLRTWILDWYPDLPAEEEVIVEGITCDILVSARDRLRSVSEEGRRKLFKLWGPKEFIARSLVPLKSLPDPQDELRLYTVQSLSGPRHLHVARVNAAADSSGAA
jgi:hypothetical protein